MNQGNEAIPVGTWIRMDMVVPALPTIVGFTYVDHDEGFSARGGFPDDPDLGESMEYTIRLAGPSPGLTWEALSEDEIRHLDLPRAPQWLQFYGSQPEPTNRWGEWRRDPALQGRFLPDFPDDLRVLIHDGGPELTRKRPEVAWVRMTGMHDDVFRGLLLNRPSKLKTIRRWDEVAFVVAGGLEYPLRVTEKYLQERNDWAIHPCDKCGLSELFDAPSELIRVSFPDLPSGGIMKSFTQFCPMCRGVLCLRSTRRPGEEDPLDVGTERAPPQRPWWQFWK